MVICDNVELRRIVASTRQDLYKDLFGLLKEELGDIVIEFEEGDDLNHPKSALLKSDNVILRLSINLLNCWEINIEPLVTVMITEKDKRLLYLLGLQGMKFSISKDSYHRRYLSYSQHYGSIEWKGSGNE